MRASKVGRSYSSSPMTTESWPLPSFPKRFSIRGRPRKSDITNSPCRGRFVWPLEHHVDADGTVSDAILVGCDQWNRAYQLPSVRAGAVDPLIQPADHPLFALAEYHHPIIIFPLHRFAPSLSPAVLRPRDARLGILGLAAAFRQPACGDGQHLVVELKFAVVEPSRQIADQPVVMLNVRTQIGSDISQIALRQGRLQCGRPLENGRDVTLSVEQQSRTIVGGDGPEEVEQFNHISGIGLAHGGAGKILEHPFDLR